MKVAISSVFALVLACGSGLDSPTTLKQCDHSLTFDHDIKPLVAASGSGHCASCHAGRYDAKSGLVKNRKDVIERVKSGAMPTDNSSWKDEANGKIFIAWASCPSPD